MRSLDLNPATTLRNCALVCRAWAPRSQFRLFEYMTISSHESLLKLLTVLEKSPGLGYATKSVRVQTVGSSCNRPLDTRYHGLFDPWDLFIRSIIVLQSRLPSLTMLAVVYHPSLSQFPRPKCPPSPPLLQYGLPHLPIHPRLTTLYPSLSRVTDLQICYAAFANFSDIATVMEGFRGLRRLRFNNVVVSRPDSRRKSFSKTLQELKAGLYI